MEDRRLLDAALGSETLQLLDASPALFVANEGQWQDDSIRYAFYGTGGNILHTDSGPVFQLFQYEESGITEDPTAPPTEPVLLGHTQFSVHFDNAIQVVATGVNQADTVHNYFVGDEAYWRTGVPTYESVAYPGVYDGIDLFTWGRRDSLKYEFRVAPGADYRQISVNFDGINGLSVDSEGALHVCTELGDLVDPAPYVYQVVDGQNVELSAAFQLVDSDRFSFVVTGDYDPTLELVIDPALAWSTYVSGASYSCGWDAAVDGSGNVLVTGDTDSSSWVSGGYDTSYNGGNDAFVAKFSSTGSHLWSSYLGGTSNDYGQGVAVDGSGDVLVTGTTSSSGWVSGGYDTSKNGDQDAFVVKLSSTGSHLWSTYLGGANVDSGEGVAVDGSGDVLVTGTTGSSGWVSGGYDTSYNGGNDAFVAKFSSTGSHLWSTYVGGDEDDYGRGVAVDGSGDVLVTGTTHSSWGWVSGGYDTSHNFGDDAFVAKLSSTGSHLWSTYLGGGYTDSGWGVAVDGSGDVLVTGYTSSSGWVSGGYDTSYNGGGDAFVAKLSGMGSHLWSTYVGGTFNDYGYGVAVDGSGNVLVTGTTSSSGWVSGGYDTSYNDNGDYGDAFVAKLSGTGSHFWSTYLGGTNVDEGYGVAVDGSGDVLVTGITRSSDWVSAGYDGGGRAFIAKINEHCAPTDLYLTNSSVPENQPVGTLVGTLIATDPDSGDSHTFALVPGDGSEDNAAFSIVADQLWTAEMFDYETKPVYTIRVRATDPNDLYYEQIFSVNVMDANDAPTLSNGSLAAIAEDSAQPVGQSVATIFAGKFSDVDANASFAGIAVIGNTANAATTGAWQYSTNGGSNWFSIGTVADGPTALALSSATLIRFVPVSNYNGAPPYLQVRGLDDTYTGGFSTTAGGQVRVNVDTSFRGGTTPIAAALASVSTSVTAVNDKPAVTAPASLGVDQATSTAISGISVSDVDVGAGQLEVTLTVANGRLTLTKITGLTFTAGANGTASMRFKGTSTNVNTALATLSYKGNTSFYGNDPLVISVSDLGNTGSGGTLTVAKTIQLWVIPVVTLTTADLIISIYVSGPEFDTNIRVDCGGLSPYYKMYWEELIFPSSVVKGIKVIGTSLNEGFHVNLNYLTSAALPYGITLLGGAGADTLFLEKAGTSSYSEYETSGSGSGTISISGSAKIYFSEFEPIIDEVNVENRTLKIGTSGNETIRVRDDGDPNNGMTRIDSAGTDAFEWITFTNPLQTLTLEAGETDNTVVVGSVDPAFAAAITIAGQAGDDVIDASGFSGTLILEGGDGNDYLVGGTGTTRLDGGGGDDVLECRGGASTVVGGAGSDTFVNAGGSNTFETPPDSVVPDVFSDRYDLVQDNALVVTAPFGVLANDIDPNGNVLSAMLVDLPLFGDVSLDTNGAFNYTPRADFAGIDRFTYRAEGSGGQSDLGEVTINIYSQQNAVPRANPQTVATIEDSTVAIALTGNDGDDDVIQEVRFSLASGPSHGTLLGFNPFTGAFLYVPNKDYYGTDSFTFCVSDGQWTSDPETVSVVISSANDLPNAVSQNLITNEDQEIAVVLLGDDGDDGLQQMLTYEILDGPRNGTISGFDPATGALVYTPMPNFYGEDSISFAVTDDNTAGGEPLTSEAGFIKITITPVNDVPVAFNDTFSIFEDVTLVVGTPGVLTNDTDVDLDGLSVVLVTGPTHGSLTAAVDGGFTYIPEANFYGTDSFSYRASDGQTESDLAIVTIQVTPVNDPPMAGDMAFDIAEDTVLKATLIAADIDGDLLAYHVISGPNHGTLALVGSEFTYIPVAGYEGIDNFAYTVNDGSVDSNTATVAITVRNEAPVLVLVTAPLDPLAVTVEFECHVEFADPGITDGHTVTWDWGDGTAPSELTLSGPRDADYLHAYDTAGVYTIQVTVSDDDGGADTTVYQYVVVYDVEAGFVTGGGWIDSPEGAYAIDPTLTGKANFGFVSRYKKGANVPTGETEFQFKVGDLNFHSDTYQWLVVAGAKAMYKGDGTINGAGDYGFMITAIDAAMTANTEVDLFRIKIWDKQANNAVIYDNLAGAENDADPTSALGGGSIVIHTGSKKLTLATEAASQPIGDTLTAANLTSAVDQAIAYWVGQGVSTQRIETLESLNVRTAALSGNTLGLASESTDYIWIDIDAAGYGWSLIPSAGGPVGVDLLSTITHEMGHKLGLDHNVLGDRLAVGERQLPSLRDVRYALPSWQLRAERARASTPLRVALAQDRVFEQWMSSTQNVEADADLETDWLSLREKADTAVSELCDVDRYFDNLEEDITRKSFADGELIDELLASGLDLALAT